MKKEMVYVGRAAQIIGVDRRTVWKYLKAAGTDPLGRKYYRMSDCQKLKSQIKERHWGKALFPGRRRKKVTRSE